MKKNILLIAGALLSVYSLLAETMVVNVERPGMLDYDIAIQGDWTKVTTLKVIGDINGTDLRVIRRMAKGKDPMAIKTSRGTYYDESGVYFENSDQGRLKTLDLSEANIVEGGSYYAVEVVKVDLMSEKLENCYTQNNEIGPLMLSGEFFNVILPKSATSIANRPIGYDGVKWLNKLTIPEGIKWLPDEMFIEEIYHKRLDQNDVLTQLELPQSLEGIGDFALYHIKSFKPTIPQGVRYIGDYGITPTQSHGFTEKDLDLSRLAYIGDGILYNSSFNSSTALSLPSVVYIGSQNSQDISHDASFSNTWESADITFTREVCQEISDPTVSQRLQSQPFYIGSGFFGPTLKELTVKIKNPQIDGDTINLYYSDFANFEDLQRINIPDGQWFAAKDQAFLNCKKIESLPLLKITSDVVRGCSSLKTLYFKSSRLNTPNLSWVMDWFDGCTSLLDFNGPANLDEGDTSGLVTEDGSLFYNDGGIRQLLVYPGGRDYINYTPLYNNAYDGAFKYADKIKSFNLKTGEFPAERMILFPGLESITVDASTNYEVIDGLVYEKGGKEGEIGALVCFPDYFQMPQTFVYNGGSKPFAYYGKYPNLKKVVIPNSVTDVSGLLPNASNLLLIECESSTPPVIDNNSFAKMKKKVSNMVFVPNGSAETYKSAPYWKEFNIVENDGVEDIEGNMVKIAVNGQTLTVTGAAEDARLEVYSTDGRMIYNGTDRSFELPQPGLYIVRIGSLVKKIVVNKKILC